MGTSGNRKSIGRAVPSRFATYLRGSACTPAALRTHGLSPGVGHRGSLREERASRGRRRALVVPASPSEQRHHAKTRRFSLSIPRHENEKAFPENADRTSVFRPRSGTVSDAARGEEWSAPPLDRHDARNRPSTGRPRPRRGVGAFIDDQRLTRRGKPRDDSRLRKRPEKAMARQTRAFRLSAGRVGFRGSTKMKGLCFCKTLRLARALRLGETMIPPRVSRANATTCDYAPTATGGPLTCWRP